MHFASEKRTASLEHIFSPLSRWTSTTKLAGKLSTTWNVLTRRRSLGRSRVSTYWWPGTASWGSSSQTCSNRHSRDEGTDRKCITHSLSSSSSITSATPSATPLCHTPLPRHHLATSQDFIQVSNQHYIWQWFFSFFLSFRAVLCTIIMRAGKLTLPFTSFPSVHVRSV